MKQIPFNKPYYSGNEQEYIMQAIASGKISGDGIFSKKCQSFFEGKYSFKKTLLTTSCTDALEMSAILLNIKEGDEVIIPSYTFVSTASAFVLRGAKIVFADSCKEHPNIDPEQLERLVTKRTKAIVIVHYAGVACDMDRIMEISKKYNVPVVEDCAQSIDSYYKNIPLGSFGELSTLSFHETKNIICGEGGLIVINNQKYFDRAEIIREKGTNRAAFFRGDVDKYGWKDIGSSFLPSDLLAAYLYAQLESLEKIQKKRIEIWGHYQRRLEGVLERFGVELPFIPNWATNNAHMYYLVAKDLRQRSAIISKMRTFDIHTPFHYVPLHSSPYYESKHDGRILSQADKFSDRLLRLPFYYQLTAEELDYICDKLISSF